MRNLETFIDKYSPRMASFCNSRIAEIEKEIAPVLKTIEPLLKEKEELTALLAELGFTPSIPVKPVNGHAVNSDEVKFPYDKKASLIDRTVAITAHFGFLSLYAIAEEMQKRDKSITDMDKLRNNLSVVYSQDQNKDEPKLDRRKNSENKWEYMAK